MTSMPTLAAIRFGYGLPVVAGAPAGPEAMLAALSGPDEMAARWPIAGMAALQPFFIEMTATRRAAKKNAGLTPALERVVAEIQAMPDQALLATFARALDGPDGFRERLVAFWADHFTVVARVKYTGMLPFALVEDAIRPNLTGSFAQMLTAVTTHPAMLAYLDQSQSVGPNSSLGKRRGRGLNENLARELMELHSLGVGAAYDQGDVRQMAELLTGLTYDSDRGMVFDPRMAEPGAEIVLGQSYDGEGMEPIRAALTDLATRPETAAHIARKLAVHFVADQPDPELVAAISAAFAESDGNLGACYAAMLAHPAAWQPQMQKVRQPYDFLIAALRALGISGQVLADFGVQEIKGFLRRPMVQMGQPFQKADSPNGWPEEAEAWITPQGLALRINWAMLMPGRLLRPLPDPVALAQTCLGDRASADLLWAVTRAEDRQQGVGLVLASADFNRR